MAKRNRRQLTKGGRDGKYFAERCDALLDPAKSQRDSPEAMSASKGLATVGSVQKMRAQVKDLGKHLKGNGSARRHGEGE